MSGTTADSTLGSENIRVGDKTKAEMVASVWGGIKKSFLYVWGFGIKTIGISVFAVAILAALLFYTPQGKRLVNWGEAKFSSSINPNIINLGVVNARFSKSFWLVGTPEIIFTSPIAKGVLTSDGKMDFRIFQPDGLNGEVNGIVAIKPAFKSQESGKYQFMGNGMSGTFEVTISDGDVVVNDFNMNLNTTFVNK